MQILTAIWQRFVNYVLDTRNQGYMDQEKFTVDKALLFHIGLTILYVVILALFEVV